jgi:hypothetical protein
MRSYDWNGKAGPTTVAPDYEVRSGSIFPVWYYDVSPIQDIVNLGSR